METQSHGQVRISRFVLAFLAVKILAGAALALYTHATGSEPPISSVPITIAAIGVAMMWYIKAINLPMSGSDIFRFSLGNTFADMALSFAWGIAMMWALAAPFSWDGVSAVLGGQTDRQATQLIVIFGVVVGSLQVFALSAFFAWLLTKKLPKGDEPGKEFE